VIFLHDTERCLSRLKGFDGQIIARIVLQEYDHDAAARILQCDRKTIERRLLDLIDELSGAFLNADLLERFPETRENKPCEARINEHKEAAEESCQEGRAVLCSSD
jgi:hypothetical protein